jgi:hypothetical protein
MRRRTLVRILVACGCLLVIVGCPVGPLAFGWFSVCTQCGAQRVSSQSSFLPFIVVHRAKETPSSLAMRQAGVVGDHEHDWAFVHGRGPVVTASGSGMLIEGATRSAYVRSFLQATAKWRGTEDARLWLRLVLATPETNPTCIAIHVMMPDGPALLRDQAYYDRQRAELEELIVTMWPEAPFAPVPPSADNQG